MEESLWLSQESQTTFSFHCQYLQTRGSSCYASNQSAGIYIYVYLYMPYVNDGPKKERKITENNNDESLDFFPGICLEMKTTGSR